MERLVCFYYYSYLYFIVKNIDKEVFMFAENELLIDLIRKTLFLDKSENNIDPYFNYGILKYSAKTSWMNRRKLR